MPTPESLRSSRDSCAAKGTGFRVPARSLQLQPAAVWDCRLVDECGLVCWWCVGGVLVVPVRMVWLLVFAKICCGNACHPVTAISVVPKLGTTRGCLDARSLTLLRCGSGVGRSANVEAYVNDPMINHGASLTDGGRVLACSCKRGGGGVGDRGMCRLFRLYVCLH
ncbi:MAG: hypothetical protein C5S48_01340 [Candidatus Methanogaster sp.]|nr:MAG: hypothetical protein C5S48_01340 [ANME-2 cluster archaeon]